MLPLVETVDMITLIAVLVGNQDTMWGDIVGKVVVLVDWVYLIFV